MERAAERFEKSEEQDRILAIRQFCQAANLGLERQLIYVQKLIVLAKLYPTNFERASKDLIVGLMDRVKRMGLADWTR